MSQDSHEREEIRKQLLPFFEELVDTVIAAQNSAELMHVEQGVAQARQATGWASRRAANEDEAKWAALEAT
jgi:hypothetical protein